MRLKFPPVFLFNVVVFGLMYWLFPSLRNLVRLEDGVVEDLTVVFFAGAVVLGVFSLLKRRTGRTNRLLLLACIFCGAVAALDEISFGERIFGITMPVVNGVKLDAVHDVFEIGYLLGVQLLGKATVTGLLAIVAASALVLVYRCRHRILRQEDDTCCALVHFGMSCSLLALAASMDVKIIPYRSLNLLEELFEMNAGLALIYSVLFVYRTPRQAAGAAKHAPTGTVRYITPLKSRVQRISSYF